MAVVFIESLKLDQLDLDVIFLFYCIFKNVNKRNEYKFYAEE